MSGQQFRNLGHRIATLTRLMAVRLEEDWRSAAALNRLADEMRLQPDGKGGHTDE